MNTMLVWYLVSTFGQVLVFSPPVSTLADCQRLQQAISAKADNWSKYTTCVQVTVPVANAKMVM